jgi:hypothetical protein
MDMKLPDRASQALWPDAPSAGLAKLAGRPKSTAHSWRRSHRRTPLNVLRLLRRELQVRGAACHSLGAEFDREIMRREGEGPVRRGFFIVRERDGPGSIPRDARNRRGRPREREVKD